MMFLNTFIISTFCFLVVGVWAENDMKVSIDEVMSALKAIGAGCEKEPTDENILDLIHNRNEVSMDTKCFRRCIIEQFDMSDPGSVLIKEDKVIEMAEMAFPSRAEEFGEMTKICNEEIAEIEHKCEAAHQYGMCLFKEMIERSFEIPEFEE